MSEVENALEPCAEPRWLQRLCQPIRHTARGHNVTLPKDREKFIENVVDLSIGLQRAHERSSGFGFGEGAPAEVNKETVERAEESAKQELGKPEVKRALCAALESTGDDLVDVAKVVSAALLPLAASGVIGLGVTPLAFAVTALLIYRAGVASYCVGVRVKDDSG